MDGDSTQLTLSEGCSAAALLWVWVVPHTEELGVESAECPFFFDGARSSLMVHGWALQGSKAFPEDHESAQRLPVSVS